MGDEEEKDSKKPSHVSESFDGKDEKSSSYVSMNVAITQMEKLISEKRKKGEKKNKVSTKLAIKQTEKLISEKRKKGKNKSDVSMNLAIKQMEKLISEKRKNDEKKTETNQRSMKKISSYLAVKHGWK